MGALEICTIGHSVLSLEAFVARLHAAGVEGLADVRRFPASRRHPQFRRDALERSLPAVGIAYRWFEALGGRRSGALTDEESPNGGLRVGGFRGYADYALTAPFREALDALIDWAAQTRVAVCCAEAQWWRCHRRIIADHLMAQGHTVLHILDEGRTVQHELWELARLTPAGPVYPPAQPGIFEGAG